MRAFTSLYAPLILSLLTITACSSEAQLLASIQKEVNNIKSNASPNPSVSPTPIPTPVPSPTPNQIISSNNNASLLVKTMQAQPSVITVAPGQEKSIEMVVLILENNSVSVLKKLDLIEMTSGDSTVATVSKEGVIKGIKEGVTPVTLKLGNITQTLVITVSGTAVTNPTPTPVASPTPTPTPTATATPASPYKELGVDQATYTLKTFETKLVTLTIVLNEIDPETNTNKSGFLSDQTKAEWSSSNTSVANISSSGLISANTVGTATMTVKYGGLTKTFEVTVTAS